MVSSSQGEKVWPSMETTYTHACLLISSKRLLTAWLPLRRFGRSLETLEQPLEFSSLLLEALEKLLKYFLSRSGKTWGKIVSIFFLMLACVAGRIVRARRLSFGSESCDNELSCCLWLRRSNFAFGQIIPEATRAILRRLKRHKNHSKREQTFVNQRYFQSIDD